MPGVGPVIAEPFRTRADVDRIRPLDARRDVPDIAEAVRSLVAELGPTPLIGFAGAPFTLASYLVEGGPSRDLHRTKSLMYGDPELWRDLLDRLAQISGTFLRVQVEAGASAVQLFDSWVGALPAADYRAHRAAGTPAPCSSRWPTLGVPRIHFGVGTGELLADMGAAGADVVGVDFRVPLDEAARRVGARLLAAGQPRSRAAVRAAAGAARARRGRRWRPAGPPAATSSTWATACPRTPTPTSWPGSSTGSTREPDLPPIFRRSRKSLGIKEKLGIKAGNAPWPGKHPTFP